MSGSLSRSQSLQVICTGFRAFIIYSSGKLIRYDAQYQMIIKSNRQHSEKRYPINSNKSTNKLAHDQ